MLDPLSAAYLGIQRVFGEPGLNSLLVVGAEDRRATGRTRVEGETAGIHQVGGLEHIPDLQLATIINSQQTPRATVTKRASAGVTNADRGLLLPHFSTGPCCDIARPLV